MGLFAMLTNCRPDQTIYKCNLQLFKMVWPYRLLPAGPQTVIAPNARTNSTREAGTCDGGISLTARF
jgi:hypothetical protein